jgi:hypothetical protein
MQGTDCSGLITGRGLGSSACSVDSAPIGIPVPTGHSWCIDLPWQGVVTRDRWKYVCLDRRPWLLFNLSDDPYELANLARYPAYRRRRDELHGLLVQWSRITGEEVD